MSLPVGWAEATVDDLGEFLNGMAFKPADWQNEGVGIIRIQNLTDPTKPFNRTKREFDEKYRVRKGDLLVSWSATLDAFIWDREDGVLNQHIFKVTPSECVDPNFLFYQLRKIIAEMAASEHLHGSTMKHINRGPFLAHSTTLPPLAEQRRIVAKLDALTARLTRARKELDRVPVLAERLRVSALHEVFGRGEAELPAGWEMKRIDEIGEVQLGRQRSPKDHAGPNMRPYVRSANITWKGWDLTDVKEMNFSPSEFETFQLRPGDVLLNEGSGSAKEVGKPAIWNGEVEGACFQNTLLRVRPFDYSPDLLRYAILYLALSGQFIANTKGVNIIHIGKAGLAKTVLPVPPLDEQEDTLAALDRTFARADRLEAEAAKARALLDRMEAAILARAFRGELVPQDPADEPASVLLDRIRAKRAAAPKPKRGRRKKAEA